MRILVTRAFQELESRRAVVYTVFCRVSTVSHTVCSLLQFVVADSSSSSCCQSVLRHVQTLDLLTTSIARLSQRLSRRET